MPPRSIRRLPLLAAAISALAGPALAHPQLSVSTINRYTKIVILPRGRIQLIYTLMVGDAPALPMRRQADENRDGRIDAAEERRLAQRLRALSERGLSVKLDGRPLSLRLGEPAIGLAGDAVIPASLSIDMSATFIAPPGEEHELRVTDDTALDPVGEVEVTLSEGLGVRLLSSFQGHGQDQVPAAAKEKKAPQTVFRFYGPKVSSLSDRSVSVRFVEDVPLIRRPLAWIGAGGALLLCLLAGLLVLKKRALKN